MQLVVFGRNKFYSCGNTFNFDKKNFKFLALFRSDALNVIEVWRNHPVLQSNPEIEISSYDDQRIIIGSLYDHHTIIIQSS